MSEPELELTKSSFDAMAAALGVRWPEWYQRVVDALLARGEDVSTDFAWLCGPPDWVVSMTRYYRDGPGTLQRYRPEIPDWQARGPDPVPLPFSCVIVGHTGGGNLVVDTASSTPLLLIIDKEGYCLKPFLPIPLDDKSPEDFAKLCWEQIDQRYLERWGKSRPLRVRVNAKRQASSD